MDKLSHTASFNGAVRYVTPVCETTYKLFIYEWWRHRHGQLYECGSLNRNQCIWPQGSILIFKATCPVGQVRFRKFTCPAWNNTRPCNYICYYLPDYWPVLSDKCHNNTTCPRSNFSQFLPARDGRTKLKVEPCWPWHIFKVELWKISPRLGVNKHRCHWFR